MLFFRQNTVSINILRMFTTLLLITVISNTISAQRFITNGSLELPSFPNGQLRYEADGNMPGWFTTHPVRADACGGLDCRPLERWSNGYISVLPATNAGDIWAELNTFTDSMIYQHVCLANGESFTYHFNHRGRESATEVDTSQFRIGIPGWLPNGSKPADSYSFPIATVFSQNDGGGALPTAHPNATVTVTAGGNGWRHYTGNFTYTGASQVVNIGLAAVGTSNGEVGGGNLVDNMRVELAPFVDFVSGIDSTVEGTGGLNTPPNRPSIRITGEVTTPLSITVQSMGGSAAIGQDYSMTVPFQANNTTPSVTITIPAGTYDGVSSNSLFPMPLSINTDSVIEGDESVVFSITAAPNARISNAANCGAAPNTNITYQILDDDATQTAANVSLSGRVLKNDGGKPIMNARLRLASTTGEVLTARTNPFGYFKFNQVMAGETYVLTTSAKGYSFDAQMFSVSDEVAGLIITPTGN